MRRGPLKLLIAYENQLGSISRVIDGLIADVLYGRFLTINKEIRENSCDHTLHHVSNRHAFHHLRKPTVLTPLRSLRTCVRNEVELVPLACEDGVSQTWYERRCDVGVNISSLKHV